MAATPHNQNLLVRAESKVLYGQVRIDFGGVIRRFCSPLVQLPLSTLELELRLETVLAEEELKRG